MLSQKTLFMLAMSSMTLCLQADNEELAIPAVAQFYQSQSQEQQKTPRQRQQDIVQKFAQQTSAAIQQQQQRADQPRIAAATQTVLGSSIYTPQQKVAFQQRQSGMPGPNPLATKSTQSYPMHHQSHPRHK